MAIKPTEAARDLDQKLALQIKDLERQIDQKLAKQYYTGGPPITVDISPNLHGKAIQEVVRRFRAAGWKVQHEFDQRAGDWLVLSPK